MHAHKYTRTYKHTCARTHIHTWTLRCMKPLSFMYDVVASPCRHYRPNIWYYWLVSRHTYIVERKTCPQVCTTYSSAYFSTMQNAPGPTFSRAPTHSRSLSQSHTNSRTHTHTNAHSRARALSHKIKHIYKHTHTNIHTQFTFESRKDATGEVCFEVWWVLDVEEGGCECVRVSVCVYERVCMSPLRVWVSLLPSRLAGQSGEF